MRKHVLYFQLITLLTVATALTASAQQKRINPKPFPLGFNTKWNAVGLRFQGQDFYVSESPLEDTCNCLPQSLQSRGNAGLLISFYRNTGSRLSYSADLGFSTGRVGTKPVPTLKALKDNFTSFRGDLYYHFGPDFQPVSPYLHTGLHAQFGNFYASIPTGAGIRFLARNTPTMLTAEVNYGWGVTNQLRNNVIFALGIYMRLNSNAKKASSSVSTLAGATTDDASCLDSDFDGVPDGADKCPRLAGSPLNAGCPVCDTDGDGVTDEKDKCPTVPGPIQHLGCPAPDTVYIVKEVPVSPATTPNAAVVIPEIRFTPTTNALDTANTELLQEAALIVRNNPSNRYVISGYSGPTKMEKQRSADQVATVVNYLVEKEGINPERLTVRSGLQGGTSNSVKIRVAADGEVQEVYTAPSTKKVTY
ncbi:MAG: hypothetical protein RLZZ466_263 [Bacteroidota bacterium]|jgi:hypothetical protein